jgi:hypothetical protein
MLNIVVLLNSPAEVQRAYREGILAAAPETKVEVINDVDLIDPLLGSMDVLMTYGPFLRDRAHHVFRNAPRLRWIQALGSGIDNLTPEAHARRDTRRGYTLAPAGAAEGGPRPMWRWLLIFPIIVVHAAFNLGVSMAVARFSFHFRDVQQFMPYALRLYLYSSGVIIPLTDDLITHDGLRTVLQLNPMYNIVEMSRQAVLGGDFTAQVWILGPAWALVLLLFGFWFFRSGENEYGRV